MEGADAGERFYPGEGIGKGVTKPVLGPVEKGTSPCRTHRACSWNELGRWDPGAQLACLSPLGDLGRRDRVDCSGGSTRVASAVFAVKG